MPVESAAPARRFWHGWGFPPWATCSCTQAAFVRIVSNPAFSPDAVRPAQAVAVLKATLRQASHQLWVDRWGVAALVEPFAEE